MVEWFMLYKKKVQNFKMFYYNGTLPYKSCTPQVVEFIFKLADMCGVNNSVKYKCVELYDRFLSEYFIYMYTNVYNKHPNKWPKVLELLKKKSFLQVMSCMQLVSKNDQQSLIGVIRY
uniref:Uncharacterized protein n=1 Tax=Sipha flava TaxID=143950 RepID=A0A2S2Q8M0_9HEMI